MTWENLLKDLRIYNKLKSIKEQINILNIILNDLSIYFLYKYIRYKYIYYSYSFI